jgi:UDP-glucose 4-epimerase
MTNPDVYYKNNIVSLINLLEYCKLKNIENFMFASTAAVYSTISETGYSETDSEGSNPISVYGKTKLMGEQILQDYALAYGIKGYIFRFFNVAGGSELNHGQPIHLIPVIINNLIQKKDLYIFGSDYKTRDGTCLRDYIHVKDICSAFKLAIKHGFDHSSFKIYNLGSNQGYTVREIIYKIIEIYRKINNFTYSINIIESNRRPGDFDVLLANSNKANLELNWTPEFTLDEIITDTILSFQK